MGRWRCGVPNVSYFSQWHTHYNPTFNDPVTSHSYEASSLLQFSFSESSTNTNTDTNTNTTQLPAIVMRTTVSPLLYFNLVSLRLPLIQIQIQPRIPATVMRPTVSQNLYFNVVAPNAGIPGLDDCSYQKRKSTRAADVRVLARLPLTLVQIKTYIHIQIK